MLVTSLASVLSAPALAADRADVPPGHLVVRGEGFEIRVLGRGVPLIENLDSGGMCRVRFQEKEGALVSQVRECPEALRDEVVPASKYWLFETTGDLRGVAFDVWYLVDGRGVTTHLAPNPYTIDGNELPVWTLEPGNITLPEWPVGQTLEARCRVTVATDRDTGAVTGTEVAEEGCPSGYAQGVADAAAKWSIRPISTNGTAVPLVFEAVVRFDPPADGAPAVIDVELPVPPEAVVTVLGEKAQPRRLPRSEPLFRLHHRNYADVLVYAVGVPVVEPSPVPRQCAFLLQVNSAGRTWIWPERCPSELAGPLEASRPQWSLVAARPRPNELYARFRGTWDFPADGGGPQLLVEQRDLVGAHPHLPEGVRSYAVAEPVSRVPPRLPKGVTFSKPSVCVLDVTVGVRGRVSAVVPATVAGSEEPGGCPPELLGPAQKSVTRWRWEPAQADGQPLETHASVRVRFGGGAE